MNKNLVDYYRLRAAEYEKVYAKPERQEDLRSATTILQKVFAEKEIMEIACGTGYWTERIAQSANSIQASDINETVLDIARTKKYGNAEVSFRRGDLYQLQTHQEFSSLFGGFIWSHILRQDLDAFIAKVGSFVKSGGIFVFMDNNYVEGSNHPITQIDEQGNTYQTRRLNDGSEHLILKNFPTEDFLREKLRFIAAEIQWIKLSYYWISIAQKKR